MYHLAGWSESESKSEQELFFCPSPPVIRLKSVNFGEHPLYYSHVTEENYEVYLLNLIRKHLMQ